jgi:hypothetical protein
MGGLSYPTWFNDRERKSVSKGRVELSPFEIPNDCKVKSKSKTEFGRLNLT